VPGRDRYVIAPERPAVPRGRVWACRCAPTLAGMPEDETSAIYDTLALLRGVLIDDQSLADWREVYGQVHHIFDQSGMVQDLAKGGQRPVAILIRDAAQYATDQVVAWFAEHTQTLLTAHTLVEAELVDRLAGATGKTPVQILTGLDEWAASDRCPSAAAHIARSETTARGVDQSDLGQVSGST
jgi:hypothetical protein